MSEESLILLEKDRRKGPSITQLFLQQNPDYYPCPENRVEMEGYLARNNLDVTLKSLTRAFQVLRIEEKLFVPTRTWYTAAAVAETTQSIIDAVAKNNQSIIDAVAKNKIVIDEKVVPPQPEIGGREIRELTKEELQAMPPEEFGWHMEHNFDNYQKAMTSPTRLGTVKQTS